MNRHLTWAWPLLALGTAACEDVEPLSVTNEEACRGVRFDIDDPADVGDPVPWVRAAHVVGKVAATDLDVPVCVTENPDDPTEPLPLMASAATGSARFHLDLTRTAALADFPAGEHPIHDLFDDDVPTRAFGVWFLVCRPSDFPGNLSGGRQCDEADQVPPDGAVVIREEGSTRTLEIDLRYTVRGEPQSLALTILGDAADAADEADADP
jgi:hypothetical protein